MALNPITIMEILRPWKGTGLDYFYREEAMDPQTFIKNALALHSSQNQALSNAQSNDQSDVPSNPQSSTSSNTQSNTQSKASDILEKKTNEHKSEIVSRETIQLKEAPQAEPSSIKSSPIKPSPPRTISSQELVEKMPPHWHNLYKTTKKAPVLWTYQHLGEDFFGSRSEERAQFLRTLIQSLKLAKGTSFFWPCSDVTPEGTIQFQPDLFATGIHLFDPQFLIIMGSHITSELHIPLPSTAPFTQHITKGRLFLLLPSFAELLKNPSLAHQATTFLATSLQNKPLLNRER